MKHLLLLGFLVSFAIAGPVQAAHLSSVPTDTVSGHSRMVRKFSQAICASVGSERSVAIDKMSPPDAMQFLQQLFVQAMQRDSVAFIAIVTAATKQGQTSHQVGQQIGKDVVINLAQNCPAAMPLVMRLAQTEQVQQAVADKMPVITDADKKVLQPLVTHLCSQLAASDTKLAFGKRTPAQRSELFTGLMQKELTSNRAQLLRYYSATQLNDNQSREQIGQKMGALMLAQPACAEYVILLGTDALGTQKP